MNYQDREIRIDLGELVDSMDKDELQELSQHLSYDIIYKELKDYILNGHATHSYNSDLHNIRLEYLTGENSDRVRDFIKGLMNEIKSLENEKKKFYNAYLKMYHYKINECSYQDYTPDTDYIKVTDDELNRVWDILNE